MPIAAPVQKTRFSPFPEAKGPEALAGVLRERIVRGEWRVGDQLPPLRRLMEETDLSYSAVNRAVSILAAEGRVEQVRGAGTFVKAISHERASHKTSVKRIGVVPPVWGESPMHYVVGAILHGICKQADRRHQPVELIYHEPDEAVRYDFADKIFARELDGLIWIQPTDRSPFYRLLDRGLPVVATGRAFDEIEVPTVQMDLAAMGELVADYMQRLGRKKLLCLVGVRADVYSRQRVEAIRAALERRGLTLPDDQIFSSRVAGTCTTYDEPDSYLYSVDWNEVGRLFLERHPDFDAVFSINPNGLRPLIDLHESGVRRCPEDFALIHLGQAPEPVREQWPQVPIALIDPPHEAIGQQAVRQLNRMWGQPSDGEDELLVPRMSEPVK